MHLGIIKRMSTVTTDIQQIYNEIRLLPIERLPELINFVEFLRLKTPEASFISPQVAKRRANVYLGCYVTMMTMVGVPTLIDTKWRMPINLHLRGQGIVGKVGEIEVHALTGEVNSFSEQNKLQKFVSNAMSLLLVPHQQQRQQADCLGIDIDESKARTLLNPELAKKSFYMAEDRRADGSIVRP